MTAGSSKRDLPRHYETLRIAPDADLRLIRIAYQTLLKRLSRGQDNATQHTLQQIEEAYHILSHGLSRKQYDATLGFVEKRCSSRALIGREIQVRFENNSVLAAKLIDLSASGAQIEIQAPLSVDAHLTILVDDEPFAQAKIVRVARAPDRYGLRWISFDAELLGKGKLSRSRI